jgi:hypothetical protein
MKKLLVTLFALSLVAAFAVPASAVDVGFSGQFYVGGLYEDNIDLMPEQLGTDGGSDAFFFQRLRLQTEFKVAPGLKLITRFDAMEGYWNGTSGPSEYAGAGTRDDDNIDFDRAYLEAATKYGVLTAGYFQGGVWGTWFMDEEIDVSRIKFQSFVKGVVLGGVYQKSAEGDRGTNFTDRDTDVYYLYAVKPVKGGAYGLLYAYVDAEAAAYATNYNSLLPYVKYKTGNLYVEAEANYTFGTLIDYDSPALQDIDKDSLSAYVQAKYTLGQWYVGGQVAFVEGDDPATRDNEAGGSGTDYDPCLILWNSDLYMWRGNIAQGNGVGSGNTTNDEMTNAWLYQVYAGYAPTKKLSVHASYSLAKVDEDKITSTTRAVDDEIGSEFDLTATYKLFDNLEYMVGFGYFWAGDWYKGTSATTRIDDDYLVINKLTLNF